MATCKDCLHADVCQNHCDEQYCEGCSSCMFRSCNFSDKAEKCPNFKDHSRFVELPCKVGDTVYAVRRCSCHRHDDTPWKSCVGKVALKSNKGIARACLYVSPTPFKVEHLSQIGKTAFLTREEAEAELARRTANG